jgi:hypothetical protein
LGLKLLHFDLRPIEFRFGSILLKKFFLVDERNFLAPLVRPKRGDVRGPHGFLQKRSLTTAPMPKRLAAAETTKN